MRLNKYDKKDIEKNKQVMALWRKAYFTHLAKGYELSECCEFADNTVEMFELRF